MLETECEGNDVRDRINRSDFMEVNVLQIGIVNARLCDRDLSEDR